MKLWHMALMAILILLPACQRSDSKAGSTSETATGDANAAAAAVHTVPVEVALARTGTIQTSAQATALFAGKRDITISAEVGGTITRITVAEGARVKKGQLLVELDHTQLDAQVASTQAQLDAAKAQLAMTKTATRPQQLEQANAAVSQAQAALDLAQKDFARQQELFAQNVISKAQLDAAESQLKQAQAAYDSAMQQLSLAKEGARTEDIQAAEANVRGLQAALVIAKETQRKAFVNAPFTGKVAKVYPEEHEMVGPGTVLLGIVDDSVMELTLGVNTDAVAKLQPGTSVDIAVEAIGTNVAGKVSAIGVKGDDTTGTFPVKLAVPNPDAKLLSGMVGNVTLPLVTKRDVLILPREVIQYSKEGKSVMIVTTDPQKGEVAKNVTVETGLDTGSFVEIQSGVQVGDKIVVVGAKNVFDGDAVNITATRELELPANVMDGNATK